MNGLCIHSQETFLNLSHCISFCERQSKAESGTFIELAFYADVTTLCLHQLFRNGESQARSTIQSRRTTGGLLEVLENMLQFTLFYSDSRVGNCKFNFCSCFIFRQHPRTYNDLAF